MKGTNYDYFPHEADIGIIGRGKTLEEAFEQAARAVFAYMVELKTIKPRQTIQIQFEERDQELALVEWLNHLLGEARQAGLVFSEFKIKRQGDHWIGEAGGEPWQESFERGSEVKGATLTMLSVRQNQNGWEARCVVDV